VVHSPRSLPASIGLVQNDIKRVLAYSTVANWDYMFHALGVGASPRVYSTSSLTRFFKRLLSSSVR